MKWVLLFMGATVAATTIGYRDVVEEEWNAFKLKHNKNYGSAEEERSRMKEYALNKYEVARHNRRYALGLTTFSVGLNEFSDWTREEILRRNCLKGNFSGRPRPTASAILKSSPFVKLADHVNWTQEGAVTPVKNQGMCGSCHAFSATGALEGQYFRAKQHLVSLSEQNLIDCTSLYNNDGCDGGWPEFSFEYVADNGGIGTEQSYPYKQRQGPCRYDPKTSVVMVEHGFQYCCFTENLLEETVASFGPVSVSIDASPKSFKNYKDGVYFDRKCSSNNLTHAVLVVGYGTETPGGDYWLIKNSWGTSWGINGYMKLARNRGNHCGVVSHAVVPLL